MTPPLLIWFALSVYLARVDKRTRAAEARMDAMRRGE